MNTQATGSQNWQKVRVDRAPVCNLPQASTTLGAVARLRIRLQVQHHRPHRKQQDGRTEKEPEKQHQPAPPHRYPVVSEGAWRHREGAERPDDDFNRLFTDKVLEVIDGYSPDMIYFDSRSGHIRVDYRKEIVSRFKESPEYSGILNKEKARMNQIADRVWQIEEPITTFAWNYYEDMVLRPAPDILHSLVDVVSKNNIYLLNIGPRADGIIPDDQARRSCWTSASGWQGTARLFTAHVPGIPMGRVRRRFRVGLPRVELHGRGCPHTTKGETLYAVLLGQLMAVHKLRFQRLPRISFHTTWKSSTFLCRSRVKALSGITRGADCRSSFRMSCRARWPRY